jgi:triphosphoribosyl-dephospho-CoA synthase
MKSADSVARCAQLAALLEASVEKPGNVTPSKRFEDLEFKDFVGSAMNLYQSVKAAAEAYMRAHIGKLIYDAVSLNSRNANFGIVIMFIPLSAARGSRKDLHHILKNAKPDDTKWIVKAIQRARLGGMQLKDERIAKYDVLSKGIFKTIRDERITPLKLMEMSQPYDSLAREWLTDYELSYRYAKKVEARADSIQRTFLEIISNVPDTLIARKRGFKEAEGVSRMARDVLDGKLGIGEFDSYLRADGNSLNPGTTADLVATALFIRLLQ